MLRVVPQRIGVCAGGNTHENQFGKKKPMKKALSIILTIFLATGILLANKQKDILIADFDGKEFKPHGKAIRFQYGNCFYASQTFNNVPKSDGR